MNGQARAHPRHDVRIEAELLFDGDTRRIGATIRDLSEGGARIVFAETPAMWTRAEIADNRLYVIEGRLGVVYECDIRWMRTGEIGVRFTDFTTRPRRRELISVASRGLVLDPMARHAHQAARGPGTLTTASQTRIARALP